SVASLRSAFEQNPSHPDVAREYAAACLAVGDGPEGVRVSAHICESHPENAGLKANLGLALLVAGRVDEARETTQQALEMSPDDEITKNMLQFVTDVTEGRCAQPTKFP
ncbi:MAG: hypothetical protein ACYTFT_14835, partial [Planctomycetota bacterium]